MQRNRGYVGIERFCVVSQSKTVEGFEGKEQDCLKTIQK